MVKTSEVLSYTIEGFFYFFAALSIPFILEKWRHLAVFLMAYFAFSFIGPRIENWVQTSPYFAKISDDKKKECQNRLTSLVFNTSTGIPAYFGYYELLVPFLPYWYQIEMGRVWMMDYFQAWSLGYIIYDFQTLKRIFGSGSLVIQLHHVAEAVICYSYTIEKQGVLYLLGGGLMQISSGLLHIQRVSSIINWGSPTFQFVLKWSLASFWMYGRLVSFSWIQWRSFQIYELTPLHYFCLFTGIILWVMNAHWLWKILSKKSLAF
jgi:hypothetical protein